MDRGRPPRGVACWPRSRASSPAGVLPRASFRKSALCAHPRVGPLIAFRPEIDSPPRGLRGPGLTQAGSWPITPPGRTAPPGGWEGPCPLDRGGMARRLGGGIVALARPRREDQQNPGATLTRDAVSLARFEREQRRRPSLDDDADRLDAGCSLDNHQPARSRTWWSPSSWPGATSPFVQEADEAHLLPAHGSPRITPSEPAVLPAAACVWRIPQVRDCACCRSGAK
jgi:hypothetical protein